MWSLLLKSHLKTWPGLVQSNDSLGPTVVERPPNLMQVNSEWNTGHNIYNNIIELLQSIYERTFRMKTLAVNTDVPSNLFKFRTMHYKILLSIHTPSCLSFHFWSNYSDESYFSDRCTSCFFLLHLESIITVDHQARFNNGDLIKH